MFIVFLQLLDEGGLTDGQGRVVDFKNAIIIMTSNLAPELVKETFRPEFVNRIDEIVTFTSLDAGALLTIVGQQVERVRTRLASRHLALEVSDDALRILADVGFDPTYGARPVKRAIQTYLENPLSRERLSGKYAGTGNEGQRVIRVGKGGEGLTFSYSG